MLLTLKNSLIEVAVEKHKKTVKSMDLEESRVHFLRKTLSCLDNNKTSKYVFNLIIFDIENNEVLRNRNLSGKFTLQLY